MSILVPLRLDSPDNYRGIVLQSVFSKVYTSVLNRRVTFYASMYDKISECQAGFREGYSIVDNAFILNAFVDKYLSKKEINFTWPSSTSSRIMAGSEKRRCRW